MAGSHAAGHGAFGGDLAGNIAVNSDVGDALHHRLGAAGIDDGAKARREEMGGKCAIQELLERLRDEAAIAEGAVIGREDGWDAMRVEFGNLIFVCGKC